MSNPNLALQLVRDIPISPEQCSEGWMVRARLMPRFCPRHWRVVDCEIDLDWRLGTAPASRQT